MDRGKIMLTGATGFLGSSLLARLVEKGYQVAVLKRSTSDVSRIKALLSQVELFNTDQTFPEDCIAAFKPDTIIHCATDYGRKKNSVSGIVEANLLFPLRLLEACGKYGVQYFINTDTALEKLTSHYSLSKKQFREWLEIHAGGLAAVNIELEHFYGAGDDRSKFVSYLIDSFVNNLPEINLTPGEQKRDFTYVDDVIDAYLLILENITGKPAGFYHYSIASDSPVKIKDLVLKIQKLSGNTTTRINFGAVPYRKNEKMDSVTDTSSIRELGWKPAYDLAEGLTMTIQREQAPNK